MLDKNPTWLHATKEEREAWINQLGNGLKLHIRQGCATDEQWSMLGIPEDIDKQDHTNCTLNRQRTVRLTHPSRMTALVTHSEREEQHKEELAQWTKEKTEHTKKMRKHNEAKEERLSEKKRNATANTACACGMKQTMLRKEIAGNEWLLCVLHRMRWRKGYLLIRRDFAQKLRS